MRGAKLAAQRLIPTGPRRTEPRSGIRLLAERAYRLAQELCAVRYASDGTAHDRPWQSRRGNASAASGCASLLAVITTSRSAGAAGGGGPSGGVQGGAERLSSSSDWQMRLRIGGGVTSNVENICDSHAQHAAMRSMNPCTMQLRHAWRLPITVPQNRRHGDWWARIAQPWQQVGTNSAAAAASPGGILLGGPESAPAASA